MKKFEFEIVDDSLRGTLLGPNRDRQPSPLVKLLMEGKTVFIDVEDGDGINTLYDAARRRGFMFRARKVVMNDKTGHLGWFEKKEKAAKA